MFNLLINYVMYYLGFSKFDLVLSSPKITFISVLVDEYKTFYSVTLKKDGYEFPFVLDMRLYKNKKFNDLSDVSNYLSVNIEKLLNYDNI